MRIVVYRLVRGDGEIVEEIVSRERQKAINKVRSIMYLYGFLHIDKNCILRVCSIVIPLQQATLTDGLSFQTGLKKLY